MQESTRNNIMSKKQTLKKLEGREKLVPREKLIINYGPFAKSKGGPDLPNIPNPPKLQELPNKYHLFCQSFDNPYTLTETSKFTSNFNENEIGFISKSGIVTSIIPYKDEEIHISDIETKKVSDLNGVETFLVLNPKTLETKKMTFCECKIPDSISDIPIINITTSSKRILKVHLGTNIFTVQGWIPADKLDIKVHRICIVPFPDQMSRKCEKTLILDEKMFIERLSKLNKVSKKTGIIKYLRPQTINGYINELKKIGLLPLYSDFNKLHLISRILGYLQADGHIGYSEYENTITSRTHFTFGRPIDAENFMKDVLELGFSSNAIGEQIAFFKSSETTHHTWNAYQYKEFASFLLALEPVIGRKTASPSTPIPEWIMKGSDLIQREYISGFMGGDGCKISTTPRKYGTKIGLIYNLGRVGQHKNKEHEESMKNWFAQFQTLLVKFGLDSGKLKILNAKNPNQLRFELRMSSKKDNLLKYMNTIGYRYATTKYTDSLLCHEWFKYYRWTTDIVFWRRVYCAEFHYYGNWTRPQIMRSFKVEEVQLDDYCKGYVNQTKIKLPSNNATRLEEWKENVLPIQNCIFEPVRFIDKM